MNYENVMENVITDYPEFTVVKFSRKGRLTNLIFAQNTARYQRYDLKARKPFRDKLTKTLKIYKIEILHLKNQGALRWLSLGAWFHAEIPMIAIDFKKCQKISLSAMYKNVRKFFWNKNA